MAYSYYNKRNGDIVISTNLKAIQEVSALDYNKLTYWFRNGTNIKETTDFIILKADLTKGRQTAPPPKEKEEPKQSSERLNPEPKDSGDMFDDILNDVQPNG